MKTKLTIFFICMTLAMVSFKCESSSEDYVPVESITLSKVEYDSIISIKDSLQFQLNTFENYILDVVMETDFFECCEDAILNVNYEEWSSEWQLEVIKMYISWSIVMDIDDCIITDQNINYYIND